MSEELILTEVNPIETVKYSDEYQDRVYPYGDGQARIIITGPYGVIGMPFDIPVRDLADISNTTLYRFAVFAALCGIRRFIQ